MSFWHPGERNGHCSLFRPFGFLPRKRLTLFLCAPRKSKTIDESRAPFETFVIYNHGCGWIWMRACELRLVRQSKSRTRAGLKAEWRASQDRRGLGRRERLDRT